MGPASGRSRGPLSGSKAGLAEGGIRVPFLLRWPGKVGVGTVYHQPVMSFDLYPTLLATSGAGIPDGTTSDGVNLLPFLTGASNGASPHGDLFWKARGAPARMIGRRAGRRMSSLGHAPCRARASKLCAEAT